VGVPLLPGSCPCRLATISRQPHTLTAGFSLLQLLAPSWTTWLQVELKVSQSYVTTDGQSASLSWCQAPSVAQGQISVTVRQLRLSWGGAPSLKRGRACRLQLLLNLASAIILGSESSGTHDHTLLSQILASPILEDQVPVLISLTRWPSWYSLGTDATENTASKSSSIVPWRSYRRGPHTKQRSQRNFHWLRFAA
jgi:hypothetical protein